MCATAPVARWCWCHDGRPRPPDVDPVRLVRTPVERVAAYGFFDIATLRALGVLEEVLVGVTAPAEKWYVEEVRQGMESGKIAFIGDYNSIDFERLKQQQPELVLTWDHSIIPMMDELGIPCAITSTPTAMCMNAPHALRPVSRSFLQQGKGGPGLFRTGQQHPDRHSRTHRRRRAASQGHVGRHLRKAGPGGTGQRLGRRAGGAGCRATTCSTTSTGPPASRSPWNGSCSAARTPTSCSPTAQRTAGPPPRKLWPG